MYMEENGVREPHERMDSELLRRLTGDGGTVGDVSPCVSRRACRAASDRCGRGMGRAYADADAPDEGIGQGSCKPNGLEGYAPAMVYGVVQPFDALYDPQTGLGRGTLFRALDLPFRGNTVMNGGGDCRGR